MTSSIVIATNNRAQILEECLQSLDGQTCLPDEVIIAHGGSDAATMDLIQGDIAQVKHKYALRYFNFGPLGAALQRNEGVHKSVGEIIFFLDDDVVCEPQFVESIMDVFKNDISEKVGGVSGTIVNQTYMPLSPGNRLFLNRCIERRHQQAQYAGRLVGPAINFLPTTVTTLELQAVDWMPSCCCAYRSEVFRQHGFNKKFAGYSFMEDVDLSARVAKKYALLNTSKAKLYHKDLGGKTHADWARIGEMQVLNRWHVMVNVMRKRRFADKARFFYYQLVYCVISEARSLLSIREAGNTLQRWWGRLKGLFRLNAVPLEAKGE